MANELTGMGVVMTNSWKDVEKILGLAAEADTDVPDPWSEAVALSASEDKVYQVVDVTLHNGIVKSFFYDVTIQELADGWLRIESRDKKLLVNMDSVKYIEMDRTGIPNEGSEEDDYDYDYYDDDYDDYNY